MSCFSIKILDTMQLAADYVIQDHSGTGTSGNGPGGGYHNENGENDDHNNTINDHNNTANNHQGIEGVNNTSNHTSNQHNIKSNKVPSRASSGASSSGFLSYRQSNNNSGTAIAELRHNNSNNSDLRRPIYTDGKNLSDRLTASNNNSSNSLRNNSTLNNHNELSSDEGHGEEIIDNRDNRDNSERRHYNRNHSPQVSSYKHQNTNLEHMSTGQASASSLDQALLELSLTEKELWQLQIRDKYPQLLQSLSDNEVKRQETIYEFIKTERSHLKNMMLMNDVWRQGLNNPKLKHIKVDRLLPGVEALAYQGKMFLNSLHERQRQQYPVIEYIGDVLANHWQEHEREITKAFSHFCSLHGDALIYYKELIQNDKKFSNFINEIRAQGKTQRKDLTDCLQLAMQRITKYSLMVNKIKDRTSNRASEVLDLEAAIDCIDIIAERVDQEVKFVGKERRLAHICKKLDSSKPIKTVGRKTSFGKADLTYDKRRLLFESRALIKPTGLPAKPEKSKKLKDPYEGVLLLMTDYLVMLKASSSSSSTTSKLLTNLTTEKHSEKQQSSNKFTSLGTMGTPFPDKDGTTYHFLNFSTGQPSVLPLRGLIIRENPTSEKDRYLLSAAHAEVGLYELSFDSPKAATTFAEQTRLAAQHCPDDINYEREQDNNNKTSLNKSTKASARLREEEERSRREYETMVRKCDELMDVIRRCDQRILDSMDQKAKATADLEATKSGNSQNGNSNNQRDASNSTSSGGPRSARGLGGLSNYTVDNPEKIQVAPILKECQSYLDDLNIPKDHKINQALMKAIALSTQQDTALMTLRTEYDKVQQSVVGRGDTTDLNKMERIHEIESKRHDRLRKKDRDDLKRMQLQLDAEREDLDEQKRLLASQRDSLERQKSEVNTECNEKLKEIQSKEKNFIKQYEDDLRKNSEQQRMLMKLRDMQRYIDDLEHRLDIGDSSTNSPKSYASASPSNSFGQSDRLMHHSHHSYMSAHHGAPPSHSHSTSSSKRSNSHGAGDTIPANLPSNSGNIPSHLTNRQMNQYANSNIRRGESLSPDRNTNSNKHNRSKSNISSKTGSSSQNSSQNKIPERIGALVGIKMFR